MDHGDNWNQINNGLVDSNISSLAINPNGYIFAGTLNGGVFRSISSTTSIKEEEINVFTFSLTQNFPNPFNPTTIIRYSVPQTTLVIIKVYNLLGSEIATLVNEEKSFGNYKMQFDGSNLSSGVYFYRMQAGNFNSTKKFILLR